MYLGINGYSHDAGACIIDDEGNIIAAVEEERFTGKKHENRFPVESIKFCLESAGITTRELKGVGYAWNPFSLFTGRILMGIFSDRNTSIFYIKKNLNKFLKALRIKKAFEKEIGPLSSDVEVSYFKHHKAHVASAFYASPFSDAAFLTLDGRGERETGTWGVVEGTKIKQIGKISFPNSVGILYSDIGSLCGFPTFQKAGTLMAFAALGSPICTEEFKKIISVDLSKDSNFFKITKGYIDSSSGDGFPTKKLEDLFGVKSVKAGEEPSQKHKDIAATLQYVTQNLILDILNKIQKQTGKKKVVLSGGVFLNSVTNGMIKEKTSFEEFYIQPAAHDAGLALGAAYLLLHKNKNSRISPEMKTACLGPQYSDQEIEKSISKNEKLLFYKSNEVVSEVAKFISEGKKVAWFQGRLEYGPRALGSRSILADARKAEMVNELNRIKSREPFRPFAISILEEKAQEWLVRGTKSPFMLLVDYVKGELKNNVPAAQHVDGSVRVQTVNLADNGLYYNLIKEFYAITGTPLIINTSFNIKGKPIVRTPDDAVNAFLEVELDVLVMGNYIITKRK